MTTKEHVDITVRGMDQFGASFSEHATLIAVADNELSLSMWRPVRENAFVEVQFYDNEIYWMSGEIMKVRHQLDGTQTVKLKIYSSVH